MTEALIFHHYRSCKKALNAYVIISKCTFYYLLGDEDRVPSYFSNHPQQNTTLKLSWLRTHFGLKTEEETKQ